MLHLNDFFFFFLAYFRFVLNYRIVYYKGMPILEYVRRADDSMLARSSYNAASKRLSHFVSTPLDFQEAVEMVGGKNEKCDRALVSCELKLSVLHLTL